MTKSCLDEYLTEECKTCSYWENNERSIGCSLPYPIDWCRHYREMEKEDQQKLKGKGSQK